MNLLSMNMRGWFRLWVLTSIIWTVVVVSIQYRSLPDEDLVRIAYKSQPYDLFGLADKIKEVEISCEKQSQETRTRDDSFKFYQECISARNRDGMKSNLELDKKRHFENEALFVREEMERLYKAFGLMTIMLWMLPILGIALLGLGIRWVIRGFTFST